MVGVLPASHLRLPLLRAGRTGLLHRKAWAFRPLMAHANGFVTAGKWRLTFIQDAYHRSNARVGRFVDILARPACLLLRDL